MLRMTTCLCLAAALCFTRPALASELLSGQRTIYLVDRVGEKIAIGNVNFTPQAQATVRYQLHIDHSRFRDYFLSMKEMKCLEGPELWCSIPYPYRQPRTVSASDLRWLEHDLLFMFKKPDAFGANFWNGIYYRLTLADGKLEGVAHALDLNMLAAPPDDLSEPPIGEQDIDEADLAERWLPHLEIR